MARTIIDELVTIVGFRGDTRGLDNVKTRLVQVDQAINTLSRNFAIAGAALTGVGFGVGRTVLSFDRAMNTLRATLLDAPIDQLNLLRKQARDLGEDTSKSATDAANAQVELARAGLDVEQVLEAIPHVLNLAIAGELEMGEAAGLVTNQLAAFKLETSETERVVDVLAKTAVSARTTVGELGPAFRQVAPLAADLGIEIEQVAAVIGTLRTGGLIPEQAGTAFRNIVAILQEDPTAKVSEGFQRLGLDFENIRAMVSAGDIEGAFKRIGEAGLDTRTALQIFGREAAVGASILAGRVADLDDFISQLEAAGGTAVEMRSVIESGLPGSVAQFSAALDGLQLSLGDSGLRGAMIWAIDKIKEFLNLLSSTGPLKAFAVAVIAAGPGLLALSAALKLLAVAFRPLLTSLRWVTRLTFHWGATLRLLRMRLRTVTRALGRFATAIWSRVSPALTALRMRLLAAGKAMLGFAATIWTSSVAALRTLATRLALAGAAMLRFSGRAIAAGIAGVVAFAASIWTGAVPALAAFAAGVWATTVALLANPITWIVLAIAGLIAALVMLVVHWDKVTAALRAVWSFVKNNWQEIAGLLLLPILGPFALIATNAFGLRDKLMGVFSAIKDFFVGIWGTIVGIFRDHWAKLLAVLFPPVGLPVLIARNWGRIVDIVGGVWSRVNDTVRGWIEAIIAFIKELPGRVLGIVKDIPDMVVDAIRDIPGLGVALDVVAGAASKVKGLVPNFAQGGLVPGPLGRPVLSLVHGGEMVVPPGAPGTLSQMLNGFAAGAAALPTAPAGAGTIYRSSVVNRSVTVNITEPIVIQTQATDAGGIAQELGEVFQDQVRNIAFDHDGPVDR